LEMKIQDQLHHTLSCLYLLNAGGNVDFIFSPSAFVLPQMERLQLFVVVQYLLYHIIPSAFVCKS